MIREEQNEYEFSSTIIIRKNINTKILTINTLVFLAAHLLVLSLAKSTSSPLSIRFWYYTTALK